MLKEYFFKNSQRIANFSSLTLLLGMITTLHFFRIGFQLVVVAWLAVSITGQARAVGQVFLLMIVSSMFISPILGRWVDFYPNKKKLVAIGHAGVTLAAMIPVIGHLFFPVVEDFELLLTAVLVSTIATGLATGGMDYFMKIYLSEDKRAQRLAMFNSSMQLALIVGTLFAGLLLSKVTGFYPVFLVIACVGAILTLICYSLLPKLVIAHSYNKAQKKVKDARAFFLYFQYPRLFIVACCTALAFSVAQATNALLPALIDLHLKQSSFHYSLIETAWSSGAFFISLVLANKARSYTSSVRYDLALIAAMAALLIAVPYLGSFYWLLIAHSVLGILFSWVRIRNETRFLADSPTPLLGRLRANGVMISNILGLIIFFIPTIFESWAIPSLYGLMAAVILMVVVFLWAIHPYGIL